MDIEALSPSVGSIEAASGDQRASGVIRPTLDHAVDFLLRAQGSNGLWRDFETLAGWSDEWVSGYVGAALASLPHPPAVAAALRAWATLRRRPRLSGGWGFNWRVPADADSTTWVLLLAAGLRDRVVGRSDIGRRVRALRLLDRHQDEDGALHTFRAAGPMRRFTRLPGHVSFQGWCGAHACVTAAGANVPEWRGASSAVASLLRNYQMDGEWRSYWWADDDYTTALALRAIYRRQGGWTAELDETVRRSLTRVEPDGSVASVALGQGSPFAAAAVLSILRLGHDASADNRPTRAAISEWLQRTQHHDGSWSPSATLRIPPPDTVDPRDYAAYVLGGKGGGSIVLDQNRVFTTAAVVAALSDEFEP